ncbi:MAG TPA: arsenate reductase (glutaredoxin) [Candidatus Poseidoniales archaeon]|nr:MAG TPA: arsenate reductase (glutaredoxin) [Candidatus Poseidoniales archaeon]HII51146.1 arsenate reductase (glutaredoxin) [Candidatus Poseidoniaceae archaeon]
MMRLYHNPRCSKSRQALAILVERNLEFEDYRYLEHGIAEEDVELLLGLEGLIRKQELDKSLNFDLNNHGVVRKLLQDNPKALERPILIRDGRAVIGRPPENILDLLD